MFAEPKMDTLCYLQNDGSQIFTFGEDHGRQFVYRIRVWPNGDLKGQREVQNSE